MNLKKFLNPLLMLVVLTLVVSSSTLAATWYVNNTNGDDLVFNGQSAATPFQTIQKAVDVAADGDIIMIAADTYNEAQVVVDVDVNIQAYEFNGLSVVTMANGIEIAPGAAGAVSLGVTGEDFLLESATALELTNGALTIGAGNVTIGANATIERQDGTLNTNPTLAGAVNVTYTSTAASTTSGGELPANLNGGVLTVNLPDNTEDVVLTSAFTALSIVNTSGDLFINAGATVAGAVGVVTATDVIDLNGSTLVINSGDGIKTLSGVGGITDGTVQLTGDNDINLEGAVPSLTVLSSFSATAALTAALDVNGSFTLATGTGIFDDGGFDLSVTGNFNRSNNTPGNYVAAGSLIFDGTTDQQFQPGASLVLAELEVNKTAGNVVLLNALALTGDFTITDGGINIGDYNIRMTGAGTTFDNGGDFFTTTGVGYLIWEAAGVMQGAGTFSNTDIRNNSTITLGSAIELAGILILRDGTLDIDGGAAGTMVTLTSSSYVTNPTVVIYTGGLGNITDSDALDANSLVADTDVTYNLVYRGDGNHTTDEEWSDANAAMLHNIEVRTTSDIVTVNTTVDAEADGVLVVEAGETLDLNGQDLTLSGDGFTHSVAGTVSDPTDALIITGSSVVLNGNGNNADANTIGNLIIDAGAGNTFTSTDLQIVNNITNTTGNSTITLDSDDAADPDVDGNVTVAAGSLTLSLGSVAADQSIDGNLVVTGGTFALGTNMSVIGDVTLNTGTINLGTRNLTVSDVFTYGDVAAGTITGTGNFILAYGANANVNVGEPLSIPNLVVNSPGFTATVVGADDITVTNSFTLTAGTFNFGTNDLIVSGNTFNYAAGTLANGLVQLTGSNPVVTSTADPAADLTFPALTINSAGTVTFAAPTNGPAVFAVTGATTQTAGNVSLGDNDFRINGAFTRTAGNWTMDEGFFIINNAGPLAQGTGWTVDNLNVLQATAIADAPITVNEYLALAADIDIIDDNNLVLGNNATIEIQANGAEVVNGDIVTGANVNLVYSTAAAITTGFETTLATIQNVTVESPTDVTLSDDMTVNGTLTVNNTGSLADGGFDLNIANNGTLVLVNGDAATLLPGGAVVPAGTLNVTYTTDAAITTSDSELDADFTIGNLTINGDAANDNVTLHRALTVNGTLTINNDGDLDVDGFNLTLNGNYTETSTGGIINGAGTDVELIAGGANDATWTLNGEWDVEDDIFVRINKTDDEAEVTLAGGNLDLAANHANENPLILDNGLLGTAAAVSVILPQGASGGQPTQGFVRNLAAGERSHVTGNVTKFINRANSVDISYVVFPVGSPEAPGNYRPALFYFKNVPGTSINLTVNHDARKAGGQTGFPITTPDGLNLTNYPEFMWYVKSDISLAPSYMYDVEFQAQGYTGYIEDQIANVRLVRRDSGSVNNQWILQGGSDYDNATLATDWPTVKVIDAQGGVSVQGSIFTYSQLNKGPEFTAALTNVTVDEGDTLSFTYAAVDPDLNQTSTLSAVTLPAGATFNAQTGAFNWIVGYTQAGTHTVTIRATDGFVNTDTTVTVTVNNSNFGPQFTTEIGTDTVAHTETFTFDYNASDVDGQPVTFALVSVAPALAGTAAIVPATGAFTFDPEFADAGKTFVVTVSATDGIDTVENADTLVVVNGALRGDADANGVVGTNDAVTILRGILNDTTFTTAVDTFRADASQNGAISAFDAYYVLYYVTNGSFPTLAKVAPAVGEVKFGELRSTEAENIVSLPVRISNTSGVNSAMIELSLNDQYAEFKGVTVNAEGWLSQADYSNGTLRIVLVGTKELKDGDVAVVNLSLKNKEAKFEVNGNVTLNEDLAKTLAGSTVKLIPSQFALSQNYPNPFNPTTNMKYQLAADTKVSLVVYDMLGQKVASVVDGVQEAGYYTVQWNGTNDFGQRVSSGVYLYRLIAGDFVKTMKMNLLK